MSGLFGAPPVPPSKPPEEEVAAAEAETAPEVVAQSVPLAKPAVKEEVAAAEAETAPEVVAESVPLAKPAVKEEGAASETETAPEVAAEPAEVEAADAEAPEETPAPVPEEGDAAASPAAPPGIQGAPASSDGNAGLQTGKRAQRAETAQPTPEVSAVETPEETPAPTPEPDPVSEPVPEPTPEAASVPTPEAEPVAGASGGGEDYQVLALRYRPQTFSDLVGQEAIARTLQNAIRKNRIWHAFLFAGPRGVGKTTTARILAKALNCSASEGPNAEPCGACASCHEIAGGYSRDVPEIDGASNNSVEKAREIIENAHYTPARDRFKIFVVDEVHMLSTSAFNALLKTLEEPPPHVKFIFATTEIHKVPDTILSRCQEFEFRAVTQRVVADRLRHIVDDQGFEVAPEALAQIARFGQGSLRDALSALDQVMGAVDGAISARDVSEVLGVPDVQICRRTAAAIAEGDRRAVFEIVEELVSEGRDLKHFLTLLMHYLRDLTVVRVAPDRGDLLEWPQEREELVRFADRFSEEDLLRSLDVLTRIEDGLRWSPEPRFHLEMALLKLVEMPRLAAFDRLLEQVGKPAGPPSGSGPVGGNGRNGGGERRAARGPSPDPAAPAPAPVAPPASTAAPEPAAPAPLDLEPPPVVAEYQKTFGGTIVSAKPLPGESAFPARIPEKN